jgi:curved DNA-binding protein CbpA
LPRRRRGPFGTRGPKGARARGCTAAKKRRTRRDDRQRRRVEASRGERSRRIPSSLRYRALCLRWHPDICSDPGADEKIRAINEAYEALTQQGGAAAAERGKSDADRRRAREAAEHADAEKAEQRAKRDAARRKAAAAAERRAAKSAAQTAKNAAQIRLDSQMKAAAVEHNAAIDAARRAESRMHKAAADHGAAVEALRRAESQMRAAAAEHVSASEALRFADSRVRAAAASHRAAREAAGRRDINRMHISELTVAELKVLLKERGYSTQGLKKDLAERLANTLRFTRPSTKLFETIAWFR